MKARICKMINIMVLIYIFNPIFASALTDQNQSISREYQPIYISSSLKHTQHSLASKHPDSYTSNREDQTGDIASYKVESSQDIPLTSQDIIKQTGDSNPKLIPSNIPGIQSAPQLKTSAIHLEQKNYSIDTQYPQKTIAVDSFLQQQLLKSPKSSLKLDSQSLPHLQSQVLSAKHTPKTSILASKGSLRAFGKEGTDNIYQACGEEVLQSVGSSISLVNKNIAPKTNVQKKYTGDSQHLEGESSPVYIQLKHEKKTTPQILAGLETNAVAVETQLASFQPAENNQESTLNAFIKNSSQETPSQVTNNQRGQDLVKFKQNTFYLANKILTSGVDSSLLLPKGNLHSPSSQVDILLADNSSSNKAEVQMYSSPEIDYTGASQPQQSSHILATAMLSLDNLSTFKLNTDSNHNGCNDSLEQEPHLASHCNFLKQQIVPSKQLPQLNLNRTQNVFNTNKTVINGVYKPNAKLELHVIDQGQDKIIAIIDTDKNANFIYLLDFDYLPLEGSLYLRSKDGSESKFYPYQVKIQNKIPQPQVFSLCSNTYFEGETSLCNPKEGFDVKVKSDYQTITKAYFNSVIHTGVAGTNQIQDVITINPDSSILEDLKSGEIHRIILQNFNPLNPEITSEPVEIFYKVHYPIFNPVLLPLFVLLSLLSVVILYDYIISNQKEFNSKLIYASYQVFKDHNSNSSLN